MLVKSKSAKPYVIFREARKKVSNDFGLATKVVNEMFPIADSCAQSDRPYIVYGETIMANESIYNYDTIALFFVVTPDGANKGIYRYFKHAPDGVTEINENKYFHINYFSRGNMMLHSEFEYDACVFKL